MGLWTPLIWSCYNGHAAAAEALLEKGADVNAKGQHHVTGLIWAAGRGHEEVVRVLLERGAKVFHRKFVYSACRNWQQ